MSSWILVLMIGLQPSAPWADTYATTANAIAKAAEAEPLFAGEDGPARTAALLVATGWFESRFRPDAIGDHGRSHGVFQASRVPVADVDAQVAQALAMMRGSFATCHGRKAEDWLAQYASGGSTCTNVGGLIASRHRVGLAMRIFRAHPFSAGAI